jgi:tetratricopeptide (TPR) repeat protein
MPDQPPQRQHMAAMHQRAVALLAAGDAPGAAALYRQVVAAEPRHAVAWALLGDALAAAGDLAGAVNALETAAMLAPQDDDIAIDYAIVLQAASRPADALDVLADRDARLQHSERAQAVQADALAASGRVQDAVAHYQRVLALAPANNAARIALGVCQQRLGDVAGAVASYRAALALDPDADDAWSNLGLALGAMGQMTQAVEALKKAVALNPGDVATKCNLGTVLQESGHVDGAIVCFEEIIARNPNFADAWGNLGNARQDQHRLNDALTAHDRAVSLAPGNAEIHWNRAMTLLLSGDLEAGFAEYEWRIKTTNHAPPVHPSPRWDGDDLAGRHILLLAEQGFGDAIQFIRYAPILQRGGARVSVHCAPKLVPLFETLDGAPAIIPFGTDVPAVDCHAPLMSVPHLLGTSLDTVPASIPYLRAPRDAPPLPAGDGRKRVGLCWAGSPAHPDDVRRSCPAAMLAPLLARRDIAWISLQYGAQADALGDTEHQLEDWSERLDGFANTATAMGALDLVITVDTATAHLAAALGRPTWLMLKYAPDWRWMLDRADSPWYPTMTLFRQRAPGDWAGVVARLQAALERWMGG